MTEKDRPGGKQTQKHIRSLRLAALGRHLHCSGGHCPSSPLHTHGHTSAKRSLPAASRLRNGGPLSVRLPLPASFIRAPEAGFPSQRAIFKAPVSYTAQNFLISTQCLLPRTIFKLMKPHQGSSCTQSSHVTVLHDNPAVLKQDNTPSVTTHILLACFTYFTKSRSSSTNLLKALVICRKILRKINNNWSARKELNPFGS